MSFTGWAATLNGVTLTFGCDEHSNVNADCANSNNLIIDGLTAPPDGLDLDQYRTEDVTFFQRDGVRHFNDWYPARIITLIGTIGPENDCEDCATVRQQRSELLKAWRRSCCDVELVIHTPCDGQYEEGTPILGPQTVRRNLIRNPSFEESLVHWSVPVDSYCRTYPRCYTDVGDTWCYSHVIDGAFTETGGTDGGWVGDGYMRLTATVVPTMGGIGFTYAPTSSLSAPEIAGGEEYTASAYLRASGAQDIVAQILWYDAGGLLLGVSPGETVPVPSGMEWTRVSVSASAPDNATYAHVQFVTTEVSGWIVGGTVDIDGVLFETASEPLEYFDGDSPDVTDEPVVGGEVVRNLWAGTLNNSESYQSSQTYEENLDRSLYGPVGIVGRPRLAKAPWAARNEQIADFTLRFDAIDHRMYVLDECGTPGYQQCRMVQPGLEQACRTYDLCYSGAEGGRCYTQASVSSVLPVTLNVGGTERINPLIVLYPGLSYPTIQNMESEETITFNGLVESEAIMIDTMNGIATGVDTDGSYTHLLGGSVFLSILPGETQFRMWTRASQDTGEAAICWRDTVVSI